MITLIIVIAAILAGAYLLLRTPVPAAAAPIAAGHASELRAAVLAKLRDRLVGWTFEEVPDEPLHVIAIDGATERRLTLDLARLAQDWSPLHERGQREEADALLEAFVVGATGEGESEDAAADAAWAREALALRLMAGADVPPGAIVRPVGALTAVLVVRSPDGAQPAGRDDLAEWGLAEDDAFRAAVSNHAADVEDGLALEILEGPEKSPRVVRLSPGDPLAASVAVVPALGARLKKRLGADEVKLVLAGSGEIYALAAGATPPAARKPLLPGEIDAGALAWNG